LKPVLCLYQININIVGFPLDAALLSAFCCLSSYFLDLDSYGDGDLEADLSDAGEADLDLSEAGEADLAGEADFDLSEAGDGDLDGDGDGVLDLSDAGDRDLDLSEAGDGDLDLLEAGDLLPVLAAFFSAAFFIAFLCSADFFSNAFLSVGDILLPLCLMSLMQCFYSFLLSIFSHCPYFLHCGSGFLESPREIPIFLKNPGSTYLSEPHVLIFLPSLVQFFLSFS